MRLKSPFWHNIINPSRLQSGGICYIMGVKRGLDKLLFNYILMNKSKKILLGIATIFPIIYIIIFSTIIILFIFTYTIDLDAILFGYLVIAHIFTIILTIILIIFYIIHILKNTIISFKSEKIILLILICFFNIIAMPVYYYIYIVKKPKIT